MSQPLVHDPHKTSHYISDELYRDVIAMFTDWQGDDRVVTDPVEREYIKEWKRLMKHPPNLHVQREP